MYCPAASCAFATMGSWPTDSATRSSLAAVPYCELRAMMIRPPHRPNLLRRRRSIVTAGLRQTSGPSVRHAKRTDWCASTRSSAGRGRRFTVAASSNRCGKRFPSATHLDQRCSPTTLLAHRPQQRPFVASSGGARRGCCGNVAPPRRPTRPSRSNLGRLSHRRSQRWYRPKLCWRQSLASLNSHSDA
jgi:hypothetical protein